MAYNITTSADSAPVAADLSTAQYKFVKLTSTGLAVCGAGDAPNGVLQNTPAAIGRAGAYQTVGKSPLLVDGSGTAIAIGDKLKSDASGRGIKTTTGNDEVGAIAEEAATTANAVITVSIERFRY